jgi:hypothetical protein
MEGISHGLIQGDILECLEGLRKPMKNLNQDRWFVDQHLNPGPPKYEAGVLTTQLRP